VPVYKIIDGYVAIVAEKLVVFDISAEGISANMAWIDVPARSTKVALEEMNGQTSPTPTAFAIIYTDVTQIVVFYIFPKTLNN